MSDLHTISIYLEDDDVTTGKDKHTDAFLKYLHRKEWDKAIRCLRKLSGSSRFFPAIARGGFVIKNAANRKRKQAINDVIQQLNERNKKKQLKGVSYEGYVNMIANALYVEFRCDCVASYYIIKNNKLKINRGWVNGWTAVETAHQMQR